MMFNNKKKFDDILRSVVLTVNKRDRPTDGQTDGPKELRQQTLRL